MLNVGDRVLGQWEPEWFYPGVIVGQDMSGIEIQFDDGDRTVLSPDKIRPLNLREGLPLSCRWQGGQAYFDGQIARMIGHAIAIDYSDGDHEVTTVSLARFHRDHV